MPWNRPTLDTIYQRIKSDMESRLTGNVTLLRRAVLKVLSKIFAGAIHLCYGYLEWVSIQLFVDTAETDYLNRHGNIWGIPRKAATFSTGSVYFTGTNSTIIPINTKLQNVDGVEYATTEAATISGGITTNIPIQTVEPGAAGNMLSGATIELISPITGVDSTVVYASPSGGQDLESDDDYRARILARIQNPPMGGNQYDYVFWAEEVSGVEKAWCFPRANGDGTVGVVIKATGVNPVPSDILRSTVYEHIFAAMPIGATLIDSTSRKVSPITKVNVTLHIETTPYNDTVDASIRDNLTELFLSQTAPGTDMPIAQIRDAISNSGVDNYIITGIELDGVSQNVNADLPFTGYEYGVIENIFIEAI